MQTFPPPQPSGAHSTGNTVAASPALVRLRMTAWVMRLLLAVYALWVLWAIQNWWLDTGRVTRGMGAYLERDLSGMQDWQRLACLGVDLLAWAMLLAAVVYGWRFLDNLTGKTRSRTNQAMQSGPDHAGARMLRQCAWWAVACEGFTVLSRPIHSWLLTSHLDPSLQRWRWAISPNSAQTLILCLTLLISAFLLTWALEIAEENRGFV